jgi:hypothetical protein
MPEAERKISRYRTLNALVDQADRLEAVYKGDLEVGDRLVVTTRNSTYYIDSFHYGIYTVSGGWFDHHGLSPANIAINGCTWGGHAIKEDILAARGLHLEFENNVVTSRILQFQLIPSYRESVN